MPDANGVDYTESIFEILLDVHFGKKIYVAVRVTGFNDTFQYGPYPASAAPLPSVSSAVTNGKVKLIETRPTPSAIVAHKSIFSFECFNYVTEFGIVNQWVTEKPRGYGGPPPVNGSCAIYGSSDGVISSGPVNSGYTNSAGTDYLYSVQSAGTGLLSVHVGGLLPIFESPLDPGPWTFNITNGFGEIDVWVYSTLKGKKPPTLASLIDFHPHSPTEDDRIALIVNSTTQGTYSVNVHQDKKHTQIDNYGKKFHPYKATLNHGNFNDFIPSQPPIRLK